MFRRSRIRILSIFSHFVFLKICYLFSASLQITSDVGFSAYAASGYHYLESDEIISFPLVMTNNGEDYNPSDSVFTCPQDGIYYFTFSLYTSGLNDGEHTAAYIQRDAERLSEAYCKYYGPEEVRVQCDTSVVTNCYLGQQVSVRAIFAGTQLYGSNKSSTFSGFLIHYNVPPY